MISSDYMDNMIITKVSIEDAKYSDIFRILCARLGRKYYTDQPLINQPRILTHRRLVFRYYTTGSKKQVSFSADCCHPEGISKQEFIGLTFNQGYDKLCKYNLLTNCKICEHVMRHTVNEAQE